MFKARAFQCSWSLHAVITQNNGVMDPFLTGRGDFLVSLFGPSLVKVSKGNLSFLLVCSIRQVGKLLV